MGRGTALRRRHIRGRGQVLKIQKLNYIAFEETLQSFIELYPTAAAVSCPVN